MKEEVISIVRGGSGFFEKSILDYFSKKLFFKKGN
jgi:hypothetical protein